MRAGISEALPQLVEANRMMSASVGLGVDGGSALSAKDGAC